MKKFGLTALAMVALCVISAGASAQAQKAEAEPIRFGRPLSCPGKLLATPDAMSAALKARGIRPTGFHVAMARSEMATSGFGAKAPTEPAALAAASQASWLMLNGRVVAAKLINDASMKLPTYKDFGAAMEMHLTVLTQPISHESTPEESSAGDHAGHGHGAVLDDASDALREVIGRAVISAQAMGNEYKKPQVRMYLLSHGFHDDIALDVASHGVCLLKLPAETISKLDVSARFMAMPAKPSSQNQSSPQQGLSSPKR